MSVIGIDIGVKNLAVCQLDETGAILNWALINCAQEGENTKDISISTLVRACALKIDEAAYAWIASSAVIAIESQPYGSRTNNGNNRMRCIQSCIETWTALRAPDATVMSIGAKSKDVEGDTYAQRKKNAVAKVSALIENDLWSNFFEDAGKKRDDLADAFLIARVAVERRKPKKRKRTSKRTVDADAHSAPPSPLFDQANTDSFLNDEEPGEVIEVDDLSSYEVKQAELEFMQDA